MNGFVYELPEKNEKFLFPTAEGEALALFNHQSRTLTSATRFTKEKLQTLMFWKLELFEKWRLLSNFL